MSIFSPLIEMFTYFALFSAAGYIFTALCPTLHLSHSFAYDGMHIDPAPEEQEIPVIEEPEDPEPELQQEEYPQAAPDFTAEEANPSEEGRQAHMIPSKNMNFVTHMH